MFKRLLIAIAGLCQYLIVFSQTCPPYPEMETTPILTYVRLPPSAAPNTVRFLYRVTVDCGNTPSINDMQIADFKYPDSVILDLQFQLDSFQNVTGVIDPCVNLAVPPCRTNFYYHADAPLYANARGFLAATPNCCRPYNLTNVAMQYESNFNYGQALTPGLWCSGSCLPCTGPVANGIVSYIKVPPFSIPNSSAEIASRDTLLTVCTNRIFSYQIQATDPDGDSIAYHFSLPRTFNAYEHNKEMLIQLFIPFPSIPFYQQYSASDPAGPNLTLDPQTGMLSGFIADTGMYDLTISALEYRSGVLLDSVMLDQYVSAYDCSLLPKPTASVPSPLADCNSFTVSFPNNSTPLPPDKNFNNTTFQWAFGDGDTSSLIDPSHTYADTGTYPARLIIFPGLWCADTAYTKVLIYPFVQASFTHDDSCLGQQVDFNSNSTSSGGAIISNHWDILLDSVLLDSSDNPGITYTFSKAPQTYTVLLTVATTKGCLNTDTQYVNIWPVPLPLATHDTVLANGAILQLQANDGNYNHDGRFQWSPPQGLSDPDTADPIVSYDKAITYSISMENSYGCSLVDTIHIVYYAGPNIYVPNAFTPNGDGRNDIFRPLVVGFSTFSYFRVFNRTGQLVFETSRPGDGWDGKLDDRPQPAGTYVWEAAGIDAFTKRNFVRTGTVILIR